MDTPTRSSDYTSSNIGPPSHVGMIVPTISEDEEQGKRIHGEYLSNLPRSIRWRVQLGLLIDPTATTSADCSSSATIETVLECNKETLIECKNIFKELVEKHVEEAVVIVESNGQESSSSSTTKERTEIDIDPLTAIVMEEEARETKKSELYLKYRKERARRKRGLTTEARIIESESDEVDRASVSYNFVFEVTNKSLSISICM